MSEIESLQHVFIIGSKGIPAKYGGFETFVDKLTEYQCPSRIKYHVACAVDELSSKNDFEYNNAHCFEVKWRHMGAARAILYDIDAINWAISYCKKFFIEKPIFYVLACRVGPFISSLKKKIKQIGGTLIVNPDGHEWKRAKWPAPVRRYWKISERGMVKAADLLVCDSISIEKYIHEDYSDLSPKTCYIAYGAEISKSKLNDDDFTFSDWLVEHDLKRNQYYLVVGRFVPENNYETMIREFMASKTEKDFALITGVDEAFLDDLEKKTNFKTDSRIKFVGTVYNQELLKKIRESAFAYFHGHEVGGTNPSLLEALAATKLNLLLDVGFNREVAGDAALYWTKETGSLANLIDEASHLDENLIDQFDRDSLRVIEERFSWTKIVNEYESLFLDVNLKINGGFE